MPRDQRALSENLGPENFTRTAKYGVFIGLEELHVFEGMEITIMRFWRAIIDFNRAAVWAEAWNNARGRQAEGIILRLKPKPRPY
jgi:hypothetical protein